MEYIPNIPKEITDNLSAEEYNLIVKLYRTQGLDGDQSFKTSWYSEPYTLPIDIAMQMDNAFKVEEKEPRKRFRPKIS